MSSSPLLSGPQFISGLAEIAPGHDGLICDIWGVIHDGARHHAAAAQALTHFRRHHGPVILLTNAPRMPAEVAIQCTGYGVPPDCYDAIVSSGGAARAELERRVMGRAVPLPLYYIGPERDLSMLDGLDVTRTDIGDAQVALAIGLVDDMTETPADYAGRLAAMRAQGLVMLCANPDLVVHRGPRMVYCAGALARDYEALGGKVVYYGKPYRPVYEAALAAAAKAARAAGRPRPRNPLAVGDGLVTDVKGANGAGLPVLFIADGVHGEEVVPYTAEHMGELLGRYSARADWAARALTW
jgi:HAD superfamily hydrolase (TIGR01459 family)